MSPSTSWLAVVAQQVRLGIHLLIAKIGLESQVLALSALRGMFDTLLFFFVVLGFLNGGQLVMENQYALPPSVQSMTVKWAVTADFIAYQTDIPREVPLVLWYKESSMQAVNPDNCTGIMGAYDLVRSGSHTCFTPGPISDIEVSEQLAIGAIEFKKRCPEITYWSQSPADIKRCYLAYNAGVGAAAILDPNQSAYVMNGADGDHLNMTYSDIELGTVQVTALGAWPVHLAIQSLLVAQVDEAEKPYQLAIVDLGTRFYDWVVYRLLDFEGEVAGIGPMALPNERAIDPAGCLNPAHLLANPLLKPTVNPVAESPLLTQDVHGCSYGLPGIDISSDNPESLLLAPIPGELTTYSDQWQNTTIRIENQEWIVWLLHARSYLAEMGEVKAGEAVGVMGSVGISTGPHVHYAVYDKIAETFVDPILFLSTDSATK